MSHHQARAPGGERGREQTLKEGSSLAGHLRIFILFRASDLAVDAPPPVLQGLKRALKAACAFFSSHGGARGSTTAHVCNQKKQNSRVAPLTHATRRTKAALQAPRC